MQTDSYEKILQIVRHVVKTLRYEIHRSQSLSYKAEAYLLSEMDKITANLLGDIWNTNYSISSYYEHVSCYLYNISHFKSSVTKILFLYFLQFEITDSYLDNIINYRKILKDKELSTLKNNT